MKNKISLIAELMIILGIFLSLTGGLTHTVHAETCTWMGNNTNWGDTSNWSCGHVPTTGDDVIIANQANDPIITQSPTTINVNTLTINSGASLIDDSATLYIYATNVVNNGTLKTQGMDSALIRMYSPLNNASQVHANAGMINLEYGGTHSGSFFGYGEVIFNGSSHTFSSSSTISAKKISFIFTGALNFPGFFTQNLEGSRVIIDNANITISNLANLKVGDVTIVSGSFTTVMSGTITNSISVPANTSFVGTGTVSGDLANAGTVSPGASPGTINVTNNYTQDPTGVLTIEIGGTTPDTEHDQLLVSGTAALDGTLQLSLIESFIPSLGDSFTLITYASQTGTFATENLPDLGPGLAWELTYGDTLLTLTVVESGGTIEGIVTYSGSEVGEEVTIGYFTGPDGPPVDTTDIPYTDGTYPYAFSGLADGPYVICAWMDLDNSGGEPDPNEPYSCYDDNGDGDPDIIVISGASTATDIDFDLSDPSLIQGTVTYIGSLGITGPISVSAHPAVDADPVGSAEDIQSGETYSIFGLLPGSYYISAYLDVDGSGGKPDLGEPLAWYDQDGDGIPDLVQVQSGAPTTDIDITLDDPILLFLPLILR
jgi:hypothetical protein